MARHPTDDTGRLIDAANRVLAAAKAELPALEKEAVDPKSAELGPLLHLVVMTWIDELANEGLVSRRSAEVDAITIAMGNINGEAEARADAPAGRIS